MSSQYGVFSNNPPLFNGTNFVFWKVRMRSYLQALGDDVWVVVESGYQYPTSIPIDGTRKKEYENNAKAVNAILGGLDESEFMKVMQISTTKEIWNILVHTYEGDTKVKKFQTLDI